MAVSSKVRAGISYHHDGRGCSNGHYNAQREAEEAEEEGAGRVLSNSNRAHLGSCLGWAAVRTR